MAETLSKLLEAILQRGFRAPEMKMIFDALDVAYQIHHLQRDRSDGFPFLRHVYSVAANLLEWFPDCSASTLVAAFLHDAIEDQRARLILVLGAGSEDITDQELQVLLEKRFDKVAASTIINLTNKDNTGPEDPNFKRQSYTSYVRSVLLGSVEGRQVKLSDITDNALRLDCVVVDGRAAQLKSKYQPTLEFIMECVRTRQLSVGDESGIPTKLFLRIENVLEQWLDIDLKN